MKRNGTYILYSKALAPDINKLVTSVDEVYAVETGRIRGQHKDLSENLSTFSKPHFMSTSP